MNYITDLLAVRETINTKLEDETNISPEDIRLSMKALVDYVQKISPLASGVYTINDVNAQDVLRTVNLPYNVNTSDYRVEGSLISKSADFKKDNSVFEMIRDKTSTSFKICLREITGDVQDLDFDWAIYPKN